MLSIHNILFVINPNAGKKNQEKLIKKLNGLKPKPTYIVTKDKTDLENKITHYLESDLKKVFVLVGGDGTVNLFIKYLIGQYNKYLCVFPNGSGNGFARELGFRNNLNLLLEDIYIGESFLLDVVRLNDDFFINVGGVGIDSFVAHKFEKLKKRGFINYIKLTFKAFFSFGSFYAEIKFANQTIKGNFWSITFANTRQYGNKAYISPNSLPNDDFFEVITLKRLPIYTVPFFLIKLFTRTLKESKYIKYFKSNGSIEIKSQYKKFHIDGKPVTLDKKAVVYIDKRKIQVVKTRFNKLST